MGKTFSYVLFLLLDTYLSITADWAASVSAYVGLISAVQALEQTHGKKQALYHMPGWLTLTEQFLIASAATFSSFTIRLKKDIVAWQHYLYKQLWIRASAVGEERGSLCIVCPWEKSSMFTNLSSAQRALIVATIRFSLICRVCLRWQHFGISQFKQKHSAQKKCSGQPFALTRSLPRDVYIRRQNDHPGGQGRIYTSHLNFVYTHLSKPGHRHGCCCMSPRCLLRQFVDRCLLFWAFFIEKTVLLCFARFLSKWRETALWLFPDATSWYELYVWWLSLRRRSRRELSWFRLVESEGYEWRWIFAGRGN